MGYEFKTMSQERLEGFLQAPRNAVVATIRKNGSPQLTPVWYLYEQGTFYFPIQTESVKYRNLQRDPRISMCIDGAFPDLRAVMVAGSAELIEGPQEKAMFPRICRRYYETEEEYRRGEETFHRWGKAALVIVTPHRIHTQDYHEWE